MKEIELKLSLKEIIHILELTAVDNFELNKNLVKKIIKQLPVPLFNSNENVFWDRITYFMEKICE